MTDWTFLDSKFCGIICNDLMDDTYYFYKIHGIHDFFFQFSVYISP